MTPKTANLIRAQLRTTNDVLGDMREALRNDIDRKNELRVALFHLDVAITAVFSAGVEINEIYNNDKATRSQPGGNPS